MYIYDIPLLEGYIKSDAKSIKAYAEQIGRKTTYQHLQWTIRNLFNRYHPDDIGIEFPHPYLNSMKKDADKWLKYIEYCKEQRQKERAEWREQRDNIPKDEPRISDLTVSQFKELVHEILREASKPKTQEQLMREAANRITLKP
jgi:hypothetical protein